MGVLVRISKALLMVDSFRYRGLRLSPSRSSEAETFSGQSLVSVVISKKCPIDIPHLSRGPNLCALLYARLEAHDPNPDRLFLKSRFVFNSSWRMVFSSSCVVLTANVEE